MKPWSSRFLGILSLLLAVGACSDEQAPPRPQWLVVVSTDAFIPLMGDRLLVELLDQHGDLACTTCRREAVVAPAEKWPVSFGIAPPQGSSEVYVRVQLFRGDRLASDGQPFEGTSIDQLGKLPTVGDGVNRVGVHLLVACMGVVPQMEEGNFSSCFEEKDAPKTGEPPTLGVPEEQVGCGGVGTTDFMPSDELRACPADADYDGMACVPGGLFFLGDTLAPVPAKDVRAVTYPEHLVAIRSFLMDRYEVSVGDYHAYLDKTGQLPAAGECPEGLSCQLPDAPASRKELHCTYPLSTPTDDQLDRPINCIDWQQARAYCEAQGKRLPNEVEWEYAAGNGMKETRYPWGNEPAQCSLAYVARGVAEWRDEVECLEENQSGPRDAHGVHDQTELPWSLETQDEGSCEAPLDPSVWPDPTQHTIFALAGNVSEWTLDAFAPYEVFDEEEDLACWDIEGPLLNLVDQGAEPWCRPDGETQNPRHSVRGGSWRDPLDATWSASRNSAPGRPPTARPEIGFRCARDL